MRDRLGNEPDCQKFSLVQAVLQLLSDDEVVLRLASQSSLWLPRHFFELYHTQPIWLSLLQLLFGLGLGLLGDIMFGLLLFPLRHSPVHPFLGNVGCLRCLKKNHQSSL